MNSPVSRLLNLSRCWIKTLVLSMLIRICALDIFLGHNLVPKVSLSRRRTYQERVHVLLNGMTNIFFLSFQEVFPYAIQKQVRVLASFWNDGDLALTFLNNVFSDFILSLIILYTYSSNKYLCKLIESPTGREKQTLSLVPGVNKDLGLPWG